MREQRGINYNAAIEYLIDKYTGGVSIVFPFSGAVIIGDYFFFTDSRSYRLIKKLLRLSDDDIDKALRELADLGFCSYEKTL